MIIRRATQEDLPRILHVEEVGFEPAEQWSAQLWAEELAATDRHIFVADGGPTVVGVISVQVLPPASDLMRIVIDPAQRRQGIATKLIMTGLDVAAAEGAHRMLLEVRYDNDAAIACYGRAGFEQLTTRPDYYGAGKDALVMRAWDLHERISTPAGVDHE